MSYDKKKTATKVISAFENHANLPHINNDCLTLDNVVSIEDDFMVLTFYDMGSFGDPSDMRMKLFFDRSGIFEATDDDGEPTYIEFVWGFTHQGLEFQEVDEEVYRIFKLHRKYAPKFAQ